MARKISFSALESRSRTAPIENPPHIVQRPIARAPLMYRRNKTNGTWVLKASDGHGAYWTNVLTFYQAQDAAKKLARGEAHAGGPQARAWSRSFPQGRREAGPAADR